MKQKKAQKKTINLSYEIYTEFQKNIIELFNEKAKMQSTEEPVAADDQPCNYSLKQLELFKVILLII